MQPQLGGPLLEYLHLLLAVSVFVVLQALLKSPFLLRQLMLVRRGLMVVRHAAHEEETYH